ncbi:conserved hypothetical protein [Pyrobaculum islandicum DSM 4184]|uniref:Uncharacterized protein n=1 Tax=Pyrobaculum islandicum (strain DSM 4184 / JCM 9189 / GEO3) TaxID=384616 RepID=A1RSQ0_PYRIL|nr:hypothetical protein [Pyrobaculum islandicum]ABL87982.1 conserved hypothetical protein [Pyrobaculum islandicum DSM 4184]
MIFLYSERILDVDLVQVVPTCEAYDHRVIPLVSEDLRCLYTAIRKASQGVVLKTRSRLWLSLAREIRLDLPIYIWGLSIRRRNIIPIYHAVEYRGRGIYYARNKSELEVLVGKAIDGVLLDVRGFDPLLVEQVVKGGMECECERCDIVERLLCNAYKEIEIL